MENSLNVQKHVHLVCVGDIIGCVTPIIHAKKVRRCIDTKSPLPGAREGSVHRVWLEKGTTGWFVIRFQFRQCFLFADDEAINDECYPVLECVYGVCLIRGHTLTGSRFHRGIGWFTFLISIWTSNLAHVAFAADRTAILALKIARGAGSARPAMLTPTAAILPESAAVLAYGRLAALRG